MAVLVSPLITLPSLRLTRPTDDDACINVRVREPRLRSRSPDEDESEDETATNATPRTSIAQSPAPQIPVNAMQRFQMINGPSQPGLYDSASTATYGNHISTTTDHDSLTARSESAPRSQDDVANIGHSPAYSAGPVDMGSTSTFKFPDFPSFNSSQRQQTQVEIMSPPQHSGPYSPWAPVEASSSFTGSPYGEDSNRHRLQQPLVPESMPYDDQVHVPRAGTPIFPDHGLSMAVHGGAMAQWDQGMPNYPPFRNGSIDHPYAPMARHNVAIGWSTS